VVDGRADDGAEIGVRIEGKSAGIGNYNLRT
jgi:hypothetical protein